MFKKTLMIAVALVTLAACSTTDDDMDQGRQSGIELEERQGITEGPMADVYGEGLEPIDRAGTGSDMGTQSDLVANVGDRVFFGYDRYDLTSEARDILERQAAWLQQHQNLSITIEGHTDERGTREYNLALGERRANSVKNYLVAYGIDPRRITVISYGKERPAVPGSNSAAWAQNRRAVTVVE